MLRNALDGQFTEACRQLDEILYFHSSGKVFDVIEKMFMDAKSDMTEKEKMIVALGLGRVPEFSVEKNHLYAFVAYVSSRAFARLAEEEKKPIWKS